MKWASLLVALAAVFHSTAADLRVQAPPVPAVWALNLQRTFALADSASPTNHPTIRVLYYGLSFTWSLWWWSTAEALRARYPHVDWRIENHSMSGHTALSLLPLAESEVFPFQPDLIIFHGVGDETAFASLMNQIRTRTTADMLLLGCHVRWKEELGDVGFTGEPLLRSSLWYQHVWFPGLAQTNGLAYADVRESWLLHFARTGLPVETYLSDGIHLNDAGSAVETAFLLPYLDPPRLYPRPDPWQCGRVRTLKAGRDFSTSNRNIRVPFTGNRVDAVGSTGAPWRCRVRVDGRPVSSHAGAHYATRCSGWPLTWVPVSLRLGITSPPAVQRWTFTVTELLAGGHFRFRVAGSTTGYEGEGATTERWTAASGAIFIEPAMWNFEHNWGFPIYPTFQFGLDTVLAGADETAAFPAVPAGEHPTLTLCSGLEDTEHVLELETLDADHAPLAALRIYHPGGADVGAEPGTLSMLVSAGRTALVSAPGNTEPAESTTALGQAWKAGLKPLNVDPSRHGRRIQWLEPAEPQQFFRPR